MANAKKCDRCGKYYMGNPGYPTVALTCDMTRTINEIGNSVYSADLCPECWKSFAEWWEMVNE